MVVNTLGRISAIFNIREITYETSCLLYKHKSPSIKRSILKGKNFQKQDKTNFNRVASPEKESIPFSIYHSMDKLSRRQVDNIFLNMFQRKQALAFHTNSLLKRQFAWKVKAYFLGNIKENISRCRLLILSIVLSVNFTESFGHGKALLSFRIAQKEIKYTLFVYSRTA